MKIPDYSKKIKRPTYLELQEEIARLTAESTKWESKFYDEAKKVDKAIEYIEENKTTHECNEWGFDNMLEDIIPLLDILKGSDKEC